MNKGNKLSSVIKVTEMDVDGCGGSADVFVLCTEPLSDKITKRLEELLGEVKSEAVSEDWSTEDMVTEAVSRFNAENTSHLEIIPDPFDAEVNF